MNKDRRILLGFGRLVKKWGSRVLFSGFPIEEIRVSDRCERSYQDGSDRERKGFLRPCRQRHYENSREHEGFGREAVGAVPYRFVRKRPRRTDSKEEVRPDLSEVIPHEHEERADSKRNEGSDVRLRMRRHVLRNEEQICEKRQERHLDGFPRFLELGVRVPFRIEVRHGREKSGHQGEEREKSERREVFRSEIIRYSLDVPMDGNRLRKQGIEIERRSDDERRGCRAEGVDDFHMAWG